MAKRTMRRLEIHWRQHDDHVRYWTQEDAGYGAFMQVDSMMWVGFREVLVGLFDRAFDQHIKLVEMYGDAEETWEEDE